jgi:type VI secretion system ImpC/EvpB family protein
MSAGSRQGSSADAVYSATPPVDQAVGVPRGAAALPLGLLESVLEARPVDRAAEPSRADRFLQASTPGEALRAWIDWTGWKAPPDPAAAKEQLCGLLTLAIAQLDQMLSAQVQVILHHPDFQKIEGSWRGLRYLVEQVDMSENIRVRVLNVSRRELAKDFERAIEFDQSQLFRKVYENEFGMPGGEPFGALLGDFEFANHPADLALLEQIGGVAAAAFSPFVGAASPALFGLEEFSQFERGIDLEKVFAQLDYLKWRALRDKEDSRFVGLTLPRVLARLPYEDDGSRVDGFCFREDVAGPDRRKYLWANACYAFGAVLVRAFAKGGWLAHICGVQRDAESNGLVAGLPVHSFSTDKRGVASKTSTEVVITDQQEPDFSELGFMPLCACKDSEYSAFYTCHSIQKPKVYDEPAATANSRISAMLKYIFCASRFAHYLKVIARDRIGSFAEPRECEMFLHNWLHRYVTADSQASPMVKAKLPLREARVQVVPRPGKAGSYYCTLQLWPHYELDELTATIRLTTELSPGQPG